MARKFSRRSWWILCERDASARSAGCKTLVWCVVHCMLWVIHTCPGWAQKFFGADSQTGKWFSASELRMLFCGKSTPPSERSLHAGTRFRGLRLRRLCSILMMIFVTRLREKSVTCAHVSPDAWMHETVAATCFGRSNDSMSCASLLVVCLGQETAESIQYAANTTLDHKVNEVWLLHGPLPEGLA